MQETRVGSLGPLEKGMATHSKILAWRIPWTEEAGGLPSTGSTEPDPTKQQERCSHYAHSHPADRTRSQGRPTGGRPPHPFSRRLTQQRRPGSGDTPLSLSPTVVQQAPHAATSPETPRSLFPRWLRTSQSLREWLPDPDSLWVPESPWSFTLIIPLTKGLNLNWHHFFFLCELPVAPHNEIFWVFTDPSKPFREFAQDWNQVHAPLLKTFCRPLCLSESQPTCPPCPYISFTSQTSSRAGPETAHLFPLSPPDNERYTNQKSKLFRVARCSASILSPGLVPATLKQHLFLPFSVWELFSLTEKTGAKKIQSIPLSGCHWLQTTDLFVTKSLFPWMYRKCLWYFLALLLQFHISLI